MSLIATCKTNIDHNDALGFLVLLIQSYMSMKIHSYFTSKKFEIIHGNSIQYNQFKVLQSNNLEMSDFLSKPKLRKKQPVFRDNCRIW